MYFLSNNNALPFSLDRTFALVITCCLCLCVCVYVCEVSVKHNFNISPFFHIPFAPFFPNHIKLLHRHTVGRTVGFRSFDASSKSDRFRVGASRERNNSHRSSETEGGREQTYIKNKGTAWAHTHTHTPTGTETFAAAGGGRLWCLVIIYLIIHLLHCPSVLRASFPHIQVCVAGEGVLCVCACVVLNSCLYAP